MKQTRGIWPAALVLLLMPALMLSSPGSAEAKKKPKPPPAVWAIEVPHCDLTAFSLCGIDQTDYVDGAPEDGLGIRVASEVDQGSPSSHFSFAIYRCEPGELCYDDPYAPKPLYLRGIELATIPPIDWEEYPCQFPGPCGGLFPPDCMECFLNGPHPHWGAVPAEDYRCFIFTLKVFDYDYEESFSHDGVGYLSLDICNTDDNVMPPDSDDHNIFGDNWQDPTDVRIRPGLEPDSWTIDVTVTAPMLFREWYTSCARAPNPKGKCPTETKLPLDAESTNPRITFQVTWTRIPSSD